MRFITINAGVPGDSTSAILARLGRDVVSHSPDLAIVLAGSNDALNTRTLLEPELAAANISAIAAQLHEAGAKTILMTPPPFHAPYLEARHPRSLYGAQGPEERLAKIVKAVRSFCGATGCPLVDLHRIFKAAGEIGEEPSSLLRNKANSNSEDGVHPTAEGARLIAACVYETIVQLDLPRAKTICVGDSITFGLNLLGMGTVEGETYPARLNALLNEGLA